MMATTKSSANAYLALDQVKAAGSGCLIRSPSTGIQRPEEIEIDKPMAVSLSIVTLAGYKRTGS